MTWAPPEDPNPSEILRSAESDTREGEYARALEKFEWFHHNALLHCSPLVGVRLSFALTYWLQLAEVYPPARDAFVRTRDETEAAFRADPANFELFHDLSALNRSLGDGARTAEIFVATIGTNHALAQSLYHVAEPFLIATGRYDVCGAFLDPPARLRLAAEAYEMMNTMGTERPEANQQLATMARDIYLRDVSTLVGLLALNQRNEEAAEARRAALAVLGDADARAQLDAAMNGHLPPLLQG